MKFLQSITLVSLIFFALYIGNQPDNCPIYRGMDWIAGKAIQGFENLIDKTLRQDAVVMQIVIPTTSTEVNEILLETFLQTR